MRNETETLLEHVLAAIMAPDNDALTLATTLHCALPDASAISVIRALLSADRVIVETFNGNSSRRADAQLARALALTLAEATDDLSHACDTNPILLGDVLL